MKYNIDIYTLCYNEIKIAPFVLDYWKRFARHIYIYDNGSDDGCLELFAKFSDWITVIPFNSDGFNDLTHLEIKNNCWKKNDADWVVVCDFDECLYSDELEKEIDWLEENKYTIVDTKIFETISKEFPNYDNTKVLHQYNDVGLVDLNYGKVTLFKPNKIQEINFTPGAHGNNAIGEIKKYTDTKGLVIHIKALSLQYVLDRYEMYRKRLSYVNKIYGYGIHYTFTKKDITDDFNKKLKEASQLI